MKRDAWDFTVVVVVAVVAERIRVERMIATIRFQTPQRAFPTC